MTPYINIHTHHLSKDSGVFLFNNRFGFDSHMYLEKYFSVGIHPWDADLTADLSEFENIIQNQNCLAIGECGLDKLKGPELEIQKTKFLIQLDLAVKYQKPVIIHCVKAFDELTDIARLYHSKIPLVIHGFNKSSQLAQQLVRKGFYLSLNHSLFSKTDFDATTLPLKKLFLETDDKNELSINQVYQTASISLNMKEDVLKEKIYSNFTSLFRNYGR